MAPARALFCAGNDGFCRVLAANLFVLPPSERLFNDYISQIKADVLSQVLQPGEFTDLERGLTFHMRARDPENSDLLGVVVRTSAKRRARKPWSLSAARSGPMRAVPRWTFTTAKPEPANRQARHAIYLLLHLFLRHGRLLGQKRQARTENGRTLHSRASEPGLDSDFYKRNVASFRSETHQRFSTPFFSLVFALLAVFILAGREPRVKAARAFCLPAS